MTSRAWLRGIAVVLICLGFLCLPNPGGSPKRFTSLFYSLADTGAVFQIGLALAGSGLALFLVTFIRTTRK